MPRSMVDQPVFNQVSSQIQKTAVSLTFGRAVDDFVLVRRVLQNTFWTEHLSVLDTVEFDLLLWMAWAHLDLTFRHGASSHSWVGRRCHGQACQHLVVHWQIVRVDLVVAFVVGTLNHSVLGELTDTLGAERVTAGEWCWFFLSVIVRLEANSALEDWLHHLFVAWKTAIIN